MTNFKFFTVNKDSTIDSIKKQYKKLAFMYHPDLEHGDLEKMKQVVNEYELALKAIGKIHNKSYSLDQEFVDIIEKLIKLNMKDVEIEVCGWFIYLHGNTKPYKDLLGKNGLKLIWNPKESNWYWKPSWYYKKNRNSWSMEKKRSVYGSEYVNNQYQERESIEAS